MANHTQQLLDKWHHQRDALNWVLATIISTEGSSYRKPGAMMMINSLGQYHGLLSGGCLESDIMRQSRQCWQTGNNRIIQYDMREEEDIAWQLGIGCGGLVRILLQPVSVDNNYLQLENLRLLINQNHACTYSQNLAEVAPDNHVYSLQSANVSAVKNKSRQSEEKLTFEHLIQPSLKIAIFGGGIDAVPVVKIATTLGWHVTLADPRSGYARQTLFADAKKIVKASFTDLADSACLLKVDAIVIMTHNVKLDALALKLAQKSNAKYIGMLGPIHRTERVLSEAKLVRACEAAGTKALMKNYEPLSKPLANPIGLRLGGELPESIALSILSEIHAFFEEADANSISEILSSTTAYATTKQ